MIIDLTPRPVVGGGCQVKIGLAAWVWYTRSTGIDNNVPKLVAGRVYLPGLQAGRIYKPGLQKGRVTN